MPKALIVEDEIALQTLYERILTRSGYEVVAALNGDEAIQYLQSEAPPQLIILDIRMPYRNGYEVLQYLQTYPDIEDIYVVIATASREFAKYVNMLPSAEFLLKPVLAPHLSQVLERIERKCALE